MDGASFDHFGVHCHQLIDPHQVEEARTALLEILEQARQELIPGATGAEMFANMHARITAALPGAEFPHHGGHALGLTSFEDPHLIPSDMTPLEP